MSEQRNDHDLAFLLRYENVAWFEDGKVRILDRRIYPAQVKFVICNHYQEVAQAIGDMVTQSAGPYTAAAMGMALAAWECRQQSHARQLDFLQEAARTLSTARPTTQVRMRQIVDGCLLRARRAFDEGEDISAALFVHAFDNIQYRYGIVSDIAVNLVRLFPEDARILTQCFGETIVGTALREAKARNLKLRLFVPETRPYLQGSRLTASVAYDMGCDVTVITDNMVAATIRNKGINFFTSAADTICMDGGIVNKVGTWQIALLCSYFGIPYYVTGIPDRGTTSKSINIEERDPTEVLSCGGKRIAMEGVRAYYPAFDITPPELVSGIVTNNGVFTPQELSGYYDRYPDSRFYAGMKVIS